MLEGEARHVGSASWRDCPRSFVAALLAASLLTAGCGLFKARSSTTSGAADSINVIGVTIYALNKRHGAPALTGPALDGGSIALAGVGQGKIVVLNVWASWCGPCREESPMLANAAKTYATQGVAFVGIDEQDAEADGRAFAFSAGMSYPNFVDKSGTLLRKLPMLPQGIPNTVVLDKHHRIAARVIGPITATTLAAIVAKLAPET